MDTTEPQEPQPPPQPPETGLLPEPAEPEQKEVQPGGLAGPRLVPLAILLIVAVIAVMFAVPNLLNAIQRGKQKRTMGDMRTLATAMESYSIDNMMYVNINASDAAGLARLASYLEPTYVEKLPTCDGWAHPLQVQGSPSEYTVISFGKDGRPDGTASPRPAPNGGTTDFRSDIVFSTGSWVQFPE